MANEIKLKRSYSLEEVLTEDDVRRILQKTVGDITSDVVCSEVSAATDKGMSGFLGDHIRAVLHVKTKDSVKKVRLFVKRVPADNVPKASFIDENNFFRRENFMFHLIDEMDIDENHPWCMRAFVATDTLIVMPDLAPEGYRVHRLMVEFDLQHMLIAAAALARFHASFANYETKQLLAQKDYNFYEKHKHLFIELTFTDTPFIRTAAKLSSDFLDEYSTKYSRNVPGLEEKLAKLYVEACNSLDYTEGALNVLTHRDLWNNNILFKYEDESPTNAVLIDYQCIRYSPPAYDLMSLLYLNVSRDFRKEHCDVITDHYYSVFSESLDGSTRKRLEALGYDKEEFLAWCEKGRMYGVVYAAVLDPFVLMDPQTAQSVWDNPDTYDGMVNTDRSAPVVNYAKWQPDFKRRLLEVTEEFVERYVLDSNKL